MTEEAKQDAPAAVPTPAPPESSKDETASESPGDLSTGCRIRLIALMLIVPAIIVWGIVQAILKLWNGH